MIIPAPAPALHPTSAGLRARRQCLLRGNFCPSSAIATTPGFAKTLRRLSRRYRRVSSVVAQRRATEGTLRYKKTRRSGARVVGIRLRRLRQPDNANIYVAPFGSGRLGCCGSGSADWPVALPSIGRDATGRAPMGPAPYTLPAACREAIVQVRLDHGFRRKGPGASVNAPRRRRFQPTADLDSETACSTNALLDERLFDERRRDVRQLAQQSAILLSQERPIFPRSPRGCRSDPTNESCATAGSPSPHPVLQAGVAMPRSSPRRR